MVSDVITPPPVKPGDTIGVFAPSSIVDKEDIEASTARLEALGYHVVVHPQTYMRKHQSAGSSADKLSAFYSLLRDPGIHAIWAAGGGNRMLHWLDIIDFDEVRAHPKALVGFSDVTPLLNTFFAKAGLVSYHGPVFKQLHKHRHFDDICALLAHNESGLSANLESATVLKTGNAEGQLIGGNLSLFQYLPETLGRHFYNGGILFLEDCNEEISRIDRMLLHLRRCGVFNDINALILGEFTNLKDCARPYGFTLEEIVLEHLANIDIPVVLNAPFGHAESLAPLAIGANASLNYENNTLQMHLL